ncbi:MAG: HlyD family efflux transporter periplasmic adaptor subunit [Cyanobacteria bacterium J06598_3]
MDTTTSGSELSESASQKTVWKALPLEQFRFPAGGYKWLLLLPLALLPVVWLASSRGDASTEPIESAQVLPVETTALQAEESYTASRTYTGELVARRSSSLGFERSGTVTALLVDEGDVVSAGTPLARLDVRDLNVQRQQLEAQKRQLMAQLRELETGPRLEDISAAEAAVSDLRNQLELAQLQAQRRADLYSKGAVSREEWDERQFGANAIADRLTQAQSQLTELRNGTRQEQVAAQVAQVDQIDAQLEAIDISLDKSVLFAPFAGEIAMRAIDEGTVVGNGQTAISLVENGVVEARVGLPVTVANTLSPGESRSIKVGNRTYAAVVKSRLPAIDEASQTVTVVLELEAADWAASQRVIGETARLLVNEQQASSGYWLPSTALIAGDRGLWSVYVVGAQVSEGNTTGYRVARRDVEMLHTQGDRTFVRGLVEAGDRVITSGTHRIVAGQLVAIEGE